LSVNYQRPPNFEQILAAFPDADKPGVIFAFGNTIHNPSGGIIPPALLAHEAVHQQRQLLRGAEHGPAAWWADYCAFADFRYREELLAHVAEYKAQEHGLDGNRRAKLFMNTVARLVAPLYNYQPPRSFSEATRDLRRELER
jgi:hypothetical protein